MKKTIGAENGKVQGNEAINVWAFIFFFFHLFATNAIHFNNQLEDISGFYSFFISYFTD